MSMSEEQFWNLIETTVNDSADGSIDASELVQALSVLPVSGILSFGERCDILFVDSRLWALWGAASLIHDGAPDDTFDYFRSWLIGRGRETYERAIINPDSLAEIATPEALDDVVYCAAGTAYRTLTGEELPVPLREWPDLEKSFDLNDDSEMQNRYPGLYVKFRGED